MSRPSLNLPSIASIGDLMQPECNPLKFSVVNPHTKPITRTIRRASVRTILRAPEDEFMQIFDGIFAVLSRECGANPHSSGRVEVSSPTTSWNQPFNVLDLDFESHWYTKDIKDSYILFDFLDSRVRLNCYALKTNFGPVGAWHLKSWVLYGSLDARQWVCLDEQRDTEILNGRNKWAKFSIVDLGWLRFAKLQMTGPNHFGDHSLMLSEFELFGQLEHENRLA
jgi:hypothetical protein